MHFRSEAGALILVSPKFSIAFPGPGPILILSLPRHLPPFYSGKYKYRFDEKYHRDLLTNTNTDFDDKYRHQFSGIYVQIPMTKLWHTKSKFLIFSFLLLYFSWHIVFFLLKLQSPGVRTSGIVFVFLTSFVSPHSLAPPT